MGMMVVAVTIAGTVMHCVSSLSYLPSEPLRKSQQCTTVAEANSVTWVLPAHRRMALMARGCFAALRCLQYLVLHPHHPMQLY